MADEIGQLGLDVEPATRSLDRFYRRIDEMPARARAATRELTGLERAAYRFGQTISRVAGNAGKALLGLVGIGSFVSVVGKIQDAVEEAAKLNAEIEKIGTDRGNPEFRTLDELEDRLKRINGLLGQLSGGPSKGAGGVIGDAAGIIGQMVSRSVDNIGNGRYGQAVLNMMDPQGAAKDIANNREAQQNQLMQEREAAEENVRIKKRIDAEKKATSEIAKDQAKAAIDNLLNEQHNARLIEDKAADDKEKKDRERAEKANQDQIDFQEQIAEENRKFDKEKEEGLKKEKELVKEILQENIRKTEEMRKQNELADLANRGNKSQADKQEARNEGARKINDALNRGSVDEAREYVKEMERKIDEGNAADASKTPAERRAERASGRSYKRGINRGRNYVRDLDDRIKRGARGSKDSAIEQRREEVQRGEQFGPTPEEVKGGGQDSTTLSDLKTELKNILKQLTPKD